MVAQPSMGSHGYPAWELEVNRAMISANSQPTERTRKIGLDLGLLEILEQEQLKSWSEKAPVWGVWVCGCRLLRTGGARGVGRGTGEGKERQRHSSGTIALGSVGRLE